MTTILILLVAGGMFVLWKEQRTKTSKLHSRLNQLIDNLAKEDFANRYGQTDLSPVVAVIPAYNEAENIGKVLTAIPREIGGKAVSILVVVDGCNDGTREVVANHGGHFLYTQLNRGGGRALSLGCRVAIEYGARYLVTLDADGQHVPAEMPGLLEPLFDGEADLVQGSRRLGAYEQDDMTRLGGIYLFGWLITLLTGQQITDSSNGFRALKANTLACLFFREDQYYSPELLLKATRKGYRVVERPVTVLRRNSGQSKKGKNFFYGYNYLRVILETWLREPQVQGNLPQEGI